MSCGLSREEMIRFDIPILYQRCQAVYKNCFGNFMICNCFVTEHRLSIVSPSNITPSFPATQIRPFQQQYDMLHQQLLIFNQLRMLSLTAPALSSYSNSTQGSYPQQDEMPYLENRLFPSGYSFERMTNDLQTDAELDDASDNESIGN
jgi:hypothetical protein